VWRCDPCQPQVATTFAVHGENSIVIDTNSEQARFDSLSNLIEDGLRSSLQHGAILSAWHYYPEAPAFKILDLLF
jgi:hypothetical protein